MSTLFETLRQWFTDDEWPLEESGAQLQSAFGGNGGRWPVVATADEATGMIAVFSIVPFVAPEDRRAAAMEAVTRANFGLALGSFDLDLGSGAIQFRTSLDVQESTESLTDPVLRHLVYANVLTMDRYLPALRAVIEDGAEAVAAIAAVETSTNGS